MEDELFGNDEKLNIESMVGCQRGFFLVVLKIISTIEPRFSTCLPVIKIRFQATKESMLEFLEASGPGCKIDLTIKPAMVSWMVIISLSLKLSHVGLKNKFINN